MLPRRRILALAFVACLVGLAACGTGKSLETLREENPQADDFTSALASEYLDYSESEAEQQRGDSSQHFAAKGLRSSKGFSVLPEEVPGDLGPASKATLTRARARLMRSLTDDAKRVAAQPAARAQLVYDCWVNDLERHYDKDETSMCANEFKVAIVKLEHAAGTDSRDDGKPDLPAHFTIDFDSESTALDEDGELTVSYVIALIKKVPGYRIHLRPEADDDGGIHLAGKRVAAVRHTMIQNGIQARRIVIEEMPSGVSEPAGKQEEDIAQDGGYAGRVDIEVTQQN